MQRLSITIDDAIKQELDNIAPKGERAAFVSKAIKKAIDDYYSQQALKKILDFKPYKIEQDSIEILRDVREGRIAQVVKASRS
jgi:predicted transcriptional regulator